MDVVTAYQSGFQAVGDKCINYYGKRFAMFFGIIHRVKLLHIERQAIPLGILSHKPLIAI